MLGAGCATMPSRDHVERISPRISKQEMQPVQLMIPLVNTFPINTHM